MNIPGLHGPAFLPVLAFRLVLLAVVVGLAAAILPSYVAFTIAVLLVGLEAIVWLRPVPLEGKPGPESRDYRLLQLMVRTNEARRQSVRDESTGLLHRWYLERRLEEEAARCDRYGHPMAVVVVQVRTADLAGMSMDGWQAESAYAAARCAQAVRNVDLSAALGPFEYFEYAVCLVHCDRAGAESALQRIVEELGEYDCSTGIAAYPEEKVEPLALLTLAQGRAREIRASV